LIIKKTILFTITFLFFSEWTSCSHYLQKLIIVQTQLILLFIQWIYKGKCPYTLQLLYPTSFW